MKKTGRPLGSKNKDGYALSAAAYHQRVVNNINRFGGANDKIYNSIMKEWGLSEEQVNDLKQVKLEIWKKFDTPSIMLMDEYAQFKTILMGKMMSGLDPTSKEVREWGKFLLDISKEINRLSTVSADKKYEVLTKSFNSESDDDFVIEMGSVKDDVTIREEEEEKQNEA